jgi:lysophospholipase L1-like esterase
VHRSPRTRSPLPRLVGSLTAVLATVALAAPARAAAAAQWVDSWGSPVHSSAAFKPVPTLDNQTVRNVVHLHAGGDQVRVHLSNAFGDRPVTFGRVRVGIRASGAKLVAGTNRSVTFASRTSVTLAVGAEVRSDPVTLTVAPGQDLAISLYLPKPTGPATWHRFARQDNYVSTAGNHTSETGAAAYPTTLLNWFFVDAVGVRSTTTRGTIAALGDSITDGAKSTDNANRRWPDVLADRLSARPGGPAYSVVAESISGNSVLGDSANSGLSALHRLDRDVLGRQTLRYVIVLEGINDVKAGRAADRLIAAYQEIISRVHAKGVRVYGGTLSPFKGFKGFSAATEQQRQLVNTWIRTSKAFDATIDFDALLRDPADPQVLRARFDSGDHLHPNDDGYRAMGNAVSLSLFA